MLLDIFFLVILAFYAYKGYNKGAVITFIAAIASFIGIIAAMVFSASVTKWIFNASGADNIFLLRLIPFLSYILVFFVAVYLVKLLAAFLKTVLRRAGIGLIDRLGGAVISALFVCVACAVLYWLCDQLGILKEDTKKASVSFTLLAGWAPAIFSFAQKIFPFLQDTFTDLKHYFERLNTLLGDYVGAGR